MYFPIGGTPTNIPPDALGKGKVGIKTHMVYCDNNINNPKNPILCITCMYMSRNRI